MSDSFKKAHEIYSECILTEDYERGFTALDALIDNGVDSCKSLQLRSHLHYLSGNTIRAQNDLDEAIQLSPGAAGLYYDRAVLHHHNNEYYPALKDFIESVNLAQIVGDDDLIDSVEHHIIETLEKMRSA